MSRTTPREDIGLAARRAQRVVSTTRSGAVGLFSGRPLLVRACAVLLVVAFVAAGAQSVRAVAPDPFAPMAIAQLAAVLGQMQAIKGVVGNQRDAVRSAFFGKLGPLATKLRVLNCFLSAAHNNRTLGFAGCADNDADPLVYERADGQPVLESVPFNKVLDPCSLGVPTGPMCYDAVPDAVAVESIGTSMASIMTAAYVTRPAHLIARHQRQAQVFTDIAVAVNENGEQFEDRMARHRAVVDGGMAIVEEWRGCQPLPEGATLDASDSRLPCVTNEGNGRNSSGGTVGMMQELAAQMKLIEEAQQGDPTQNQIQAMTTQVAIMQTRIAAAGLELRAASVEDAQQSQLQGEADLRRSHELWLLRMDCLDGRAGQPAHAFNVFVPNSEGAAAGECLGTPGLLPAP